jgi:hypothetical protein
MQTEAIQSFIKTHKVAENRYLKITFKKRDAVFGIIVHSSDSSDLEPKNFWRVVTFTNIKDWQNSKNINFSRIFNGHEFAKLSVE